MRVMSFTPISKPTPFKGQTRPAPAASLPPTPKFGIEPVTATAIVVASGGIASMAYAMRRLHAIDKLLNGLTFTDKDEKDLPFQRWNPWTWTFTIGEGKSVMTPSPSQLGWKKTDTGYELYNLKSKALVLRISSDAKDAAAVQEDLERFYKHFLANFDPVA